MRRAAQESATPEDVGTRLAPLGLTLAGMQGAAMAYRHGLAAATENDPTNAAGFFGWVFGTRFLRDHLIPQGWRKCNEGGYPRVVNDDLRIAIAVSSADENTGREGGDAPRTKGSKGPRTVAAIVTNVQQLSLFESENFGSTTESRLHPSRPIAGHEVETRTDDLKHGDGFVTWLLLLYATPDEIRSELSLPVEVDDTSRPGQWLERIILPPVKFETSVTPLDLPQDGPDFDVTVTRRPR